MHLWNKFRHILGWLFVKGSVICTFYVGIVFAIQMLYDLKKDTTQITNAAFVIAATLASLCFALARSVESDDADRDRFTYCGERFLHAGILLIIASLLKYAALYMRKAEFSDFVSVLAEIPVALLSLMVIPLFNYAVIYAHTGLTICSKLLWARAQRDPDWDKIY